MIIIRIRSKYNKTKITLANMPYKQQEVQTCQCIESPEIFTRAKVTGQRSKGPSVLCTPRACITSVIVVRTVHLKRNKANDPHHNGQLYTMEPVEVDMCTFNVYQSSQIRTCLGRANTLLSDNAQWNPSILDP